MQWYSNLFFVDLKKVYIISIHQCPGTIWALQGAIAFRLPLIVVVLCSSHVMNELLETERAYVEELLCVLEVSARFLCVSIHGHRWFRTNPITGRINGRSAGKVNYMDVMYVILGLCSRDGQPCHGSPHPQQPAKQEGYSFWEHVWNLPVP